MDEGAAEGELLLHSTREFAGRPVSEGRQLVVDVADEGIVFRYAHPEEVGKEVEIFGHGEVAIEGERARHVADGAAQAAVGAHHVLPVHDRRAAGGQEEGGEDAEEGRLARAVRPHEAEHFSLLDVDVDAAEGVDAAVVVGFGELSDGDEGHDFFLRAAKVGLLLYGRRGKAHLAIHAALDEAIVEDTHLDGVDEVGALIAGLDGAWGELRLVGYPHEGAGVGFLRLRPLVGIDGDLLSQAQGGELRRVDVGAEVECAEVGQGEQRPSRGGVLSLFGKGGDDGACDGGGDATVANLVVELCDLLHDGVALC